MHKFMNTEAEYIFNCTLKRIHKNAFRINEVNSLSDNDDINHYTKSIHDTCGGIELLDIGVLNVGDDSILSLFKKRTTDSERLKKNFNIDLYSIPPDPVLLKTLLKRSFYVFDPRRNDIKIPIPTYTDKNFKIEIVDVPKILELPEKLRLNLNPNIKICVIDSGIDLDHPAFEGIINKEKYKCFCDKDKNSKEEYLDGVGHGTHVASLLFGKEWVGEDGKLYCGIIKDPNIQRYFAKIFPYNNSSAKTIDILKALDWAVFQENVDIINMSIGSLAPPDGQSILTKVVNKCIEHGTFFSISAGNSGPEISSISPPADSSGLAVGAINKSYFLCEFSSRGDNSGKYPSISTKPDIVTPGEEIIGAFSKDSMDNRNKKPHQKHSEIVLSGTSMAAPIAAGLAGIILSKNMSKDPTIQSKNPIQLKKSLIEFCSKEKLVERYNDHEVGAGLPLLNNIQTSITSVDERTTSMPNGNKPYHIFKILPVDIQAAEDNNYIGSILEVVDSNSSLAVFKKDSGGNYDIYIGLDITKMELGQLPKLVSIASLNDPLKSHKGFDFKAWSNINNGVDFSGVSREKKKVYRVQKNEGRDENDSFYEIADFSNIEHQNVLKLCGSLLDQYSIEKYVQVWECADGTLWDLTQNKNNNYLFHPINIIEIFRQLFSGLDFLNKKDKICGDIHLRNIFYTDENNDRVFKLGDLLPKTLVRKYQANPNCIAPDRMAPEEILNQTAQINTDAYRLSFLLYEMLCDKSPLDDIDNSNLLEYENLLIASKELYYKNSLEKDLRNITKIKFSTNGSIFESLLKLFRRGLNPDYKTRLMDKDLVSDTINLLHSIVLFFESPEIKKDNNSGSADSANSSRGSETNNRNDNGLILKRPSLSEISHINKWKQYFLFPFIIALLVGLLLVIIGSYPTLNIIKFSNENKLPYKDFKGDTLKLWVNDLIFSIRLQVDININGANIEVNKRSGELYILPFEEIIDNKLLQLQNKRELKFKIIARVRNIFFLHDTKEVDFSLYADADSNKPDIPPMDPLSGFIQSKDNKTLKEKVKIIIPLHFRYGPFTNEYGSFYASKDQQGLINKILWVEKNDSLMVPSECPAERINESNAQTKIKKVVECMMDNKIVR